MPVIGVLLPGSTLYPSIGIDFLQGIKSCLNYYQTTNIDLTVFPVAYGLDEGEIYRQAEKFLLVDDADVVVAYIDDRLATVLSPLFAAAGKLLIIINAGANYPISKTALPHILFNTLNDSLYCFLTGRVCSTEGTANNKAVLATSFYDGGYQHCHAITNGFNLAGGEIGFNFVSHFKKEQFTIEAFAAFVKSNPAVKKVLCVYCGDMARCFYEQVALLQEEAELQLYGSPMMLDNTPGDFDPAKHIIQQVKGYVGWLPELDNEDNNNFKASYQKQYSKEANLFSLQGWETALLLLEFLQQRTAGAATATAIDQLKNVVIHSPRGKLTINDNCYISGPAYLANAGKDGTIVIEDTIENTSTILHEMLLHIPEQEFSSWRNTYLCI